MNTVYTVSGRITEQGTVELDEPLRMAPGPVRIAVERVYGGPASTWVIDEEDWKRRKAMMDSAIGCPSDEDARKILEIVEQEFGARSLPTPD